MSDSSPATGSGENTKKDASERPTRGSGGTLRVLAIHAHPDDIEFQCAGTLALLAQRGHQVVIASMTPGDCGSMDQPPEQIAAIRRAEAQAAAELVQGDYHCLEFRDLSIVVDQDSKRRVTEFIRRVAPDLVLTAAPEDYMDDHEATSRLVRDGCFNASVPNYTTRQWEPAPATSKIPWLYYVDPIEGIDHRGQPVLPEFYVDITETFAIKQQMLACHASQREWLRAQHGVDEYLQSQKRWAQQRGQEVSVPYAEALTQHRSHAYPATNLLQQQLGELVKVIG